MLGLTVAAVVLGAGLLKNRRAPAPPPPPAPAPSAPAVPEPPPPRPVPPPAGPAEPALPFDLVEASRQAGLVFTHRPFRAHPSLENIHGWLAAIGVGVAVADVDGDGRPDVYVTNTAWRSQNALFLNQGGGRFREAGAEWGLADVNQRWPSGRPLFVDVDNDGDRDLVLATTFCPQLFINEGKRFAPREGAGGLDYCGLTLASNALDYDGDGDLDVVLAGYFPEVDFSSPTTTMFMQNSLTEADNGGLTVVYENDGTGRFKRADGPGMPGGRHWTNAVGVWDFDDDGRPDLFFATDYNKDRVYLNRGGGRFEDASESVAHKYSRSGMNADVAELFAPGRPAVYVTHIYEPPYRIGPNALWTWTGDARRFTDVGRESGAGTCGWSWAGKFVDLDSDGREDLVVTNGFISGDPLKNYWYKMSLMASAAGLVLADSRNWLPFEDYSMSGFQRKCVYLNDGARLVPVTARTGMKDDVSDGRAVAVIDPDGDGSQDLVMGNQSQPLRYYRNEARHKNRWVGFSLVGTRSNRDAWGARVRVRAGTKTLTRRLWPANAFMSQSDARPFFGLGDWAGTVDAEVRWPSGAVSTLTGLAAGRYHRVVEPK